MTQATLPMLPAAPPKTSGLAVASLVLGVTNVVLLSCCCGTGFIPAVLAIVFGHVAQYQIKRSAGRLEGSSLAIAGLACGYIGLVIQVLTIIATMAVFLISAVAGHHHAHVNVQRW
jgi:hypothetical protein